MHSDGRALTVANRPKAAAREWRVLTGRCRTRTVAWADREHLLYASTLSKGPTP
jgi:hypothetical protein